MTQGSFRITWVHSGTPRGRRFNSHSRGITRARLVIAGFVRFPKGLLGRAYRSPVHSGKFWVPRAPLGVTGFIRVRVGSFGRAYWSSDSFGLALVRLGAHIGRRAHSASRGLTRARLWVALLAWVHLGAPWVHSARLVIAGFIRVR